ncbi:MAG: WD40 repeat domain-containing protein [Candidatus Acidiferrales bacterium]
MATSPDDLEAVRRPTKALHLSISKATQVRVVKSSSYVFVIFIVFLSLSVGMIAHEDGPNSFHVYKLDTGWDTNGADISPDSRFVAVEASKGSKEGQSIELVNEIQVWDFRNRKRVASKVLSREKFSDPHDISSDPQFVRYADAGAKIVVCQLDHLLVLDSKTLDQLQSIDLGKVTWPRVPPNWSSDSHVADAEVNANATRAAVLLAWGAGGGQLRVYDLTSGSLIRKWDFGTDFPGRGPISIDPEGRQVAISLGLFSPGERLLRSKERNVLILNVDSGKIGTAINTGYIAGGICFASSGTLLTVSLNPEQRYFPKDTLKIWNAQTGKLMRQIASPPGGIHDSVAVSANGRVALAYIGLEKKDSHWWQETDYVTVYQRFRLWDLDTGRVIATSPDILPIVPGNPNFRLSPRGDVVVIYPVTTGGPMVFYGLR